MKRQIFALLLVLTAFACQHDYYETGDSGLSYLHTSFVEAFTNASTAFVSATTDDDVSLMLLPAISAKWATTADSTYRAMLYYNKVENGVTEPVAIRSVLTLSPIPIAKAKDRHTNPLTLESMWIAKNNKYLNLSLVIKTGKSNDNKAIQTVGLLQTAVRQQSSAPHNSYYLTLTHNQAGVPQYYSAKAYASIPLAEYQQGDSLYITVNTYKGKVVKNFQL